MDEGKELGGDQEVLIKEAWRILDELIRTGKAQLQSGTVVAPSADSFVRHCQWLASLQKPRRKITLPEDVFKPKETV